LSSDGFFSPTHFSATLRVIGDDMIEVMELSLYELGKLSTLGSSYSNTLPFSRHLNYRFYFEKVC